MKCNASCWDSPRHFCVHTAGRNHGRVGGEKPTRWPQTTLLFGKFKFNCYFGLLTLQDIQYKIPSYSSRNCRGQVTYYLWTCFPYIHWSWFSPVPQVPGMYWEYQPHKRLCSHRNWSQRNQQVMRMLPGHQPDLTVCLQSVDLEFQSCNQRINKINSLRLN